MGYYDEPVSAPVSRRVKIDPKPNANVNVTKTVEVEVKSIRGYSLDQREPNLKTFPSLKLTSGEHEGTTTVNIRIPTSGEFSLDDVIHGLQELKKSL